MNFILYENKWDKIIANNHQFLGINNAIDTFKDRKNLYDKLGVSWHTTGSGKTAVLMMTPYILEAKKVLIITPSRLVRSQVSDEYSTLQTLIRINVLPENIIKPQVFEMKNIFKEELKKDIEEADIVVATPQVGLSVSKVNNIRRKFDLVLIDEAHHVPAKTWTEILENMNEAKQVLFTATPFVWIIKR